MNKKNFNPKNSTNSQKNPSSSTNKFKSTPSHHSKSKKISEAVKKLNLKDFYQLCKQLEDEVNVKKSSLLVWLHILYDLREAIEAHQHASKDDLVKELTILNDCFRTIVSVLTFSNTVYQDDEDYKSVKNLLETIFDLLVLLFEKKEETIASSSVSKKKVSSKTLPASLFNSLFTNLSQCINRMCPAIALRNSKQFQLIIKNIKAPSSTTSVLESSISYDSLCPITNSFFTNYQQKTCRRENDSIFFVLKIINLLISHDPVNILTYWDTFLVDSYSTENLLTKSFQQLPLVQRPISFCKFNEVDFKNNHAENNDSFLPLLSSQVFSSSAGYQFPINLTENNMIYSRLNHISNLKFESLSSQKFSSFIFSLIFSHSNTRMRKEALQTLTNFINIPSLNHWVLHFYQQKKHELQHKASSIVSLNTNNTRQKNNLIQSNNNSLSSKINKILKKSIYINTILLILESKIEIFQTILSFFSVIINLLPMILINEKVELNSSLFNYTNKEIEKILRLLFMISFEVTPVLNMEVMTVSGQFHSKFNLPPFFITIINDKDKKKNKFQFSERAVACIHWLHVTLRSIPIQNSLSQQEESILSIFQKVLIDDDSVHQPELFSCHFHSCLNSSPFGVYLRDIEKQMEPTLFKSINSEKFSCLLFNIVYIYSYSSQRQNSTNDPLPLLTYNIIRLVLPLLLSSTSQNFDPKINYIIKFFINFLNFLKNSTSDTDKELYIKLLGLLYDSREFWILIGIHHEILSANNNEKIKSQGKKTLFDLKSNLLFNYISTSTNIITLLNFLLESITLSSNSVIKLRVLETMSKIDPYFWLLWSNVSVSINGSNEILEIQYDPKKDKSKFESKSILLCHIVLLFLIRCTNDSLGTVRGAAYRVIGKCLSSWSGLEEIEKIEEGEEVDFYSNIEKKVDPIDIKIVNNINLDIQSLYKNKKIKKIFFSDENISENFLSKFISNNFQLLNNNNFFVFPNSLRLWIELFIFGSQDSKLSVRIQSSWCLNLITVMHQLQYRFDSNSSLKKKLYHQDILCFNQSYGSLIFDDFDDIINTSNQINEEDNEFNQDEINYSFYKEIYSTPTKNEHKENINLEYEFNITEYLGYIITNKNSYISYDIENKTKECYLENYNSMFLLFSNLINLELKNLDDSEKIIPTSLRGLGYTLICYGPLLINNLLNFYSISSDNIKFLEEIDYQVKKILQINFNVFNALKAKYNINIDDNFNDLEDEVNESFIMTTILKMFVKKYSIKVLCSLLQTFLYIYISSHLIQFDYDLFYKKENCLLNNSCSNSHINKSLTFMNIFYSNNSCSTSYLVLNTSNNRSLLPSLHDNFLPLLFLVSSLSHGPIQLQLLAGRSLLYLVLGLPQLQIIKTIEKIGDEDNKEISILYPMPIDYIFNIIETSLLLLDDLSQSSFNLSPLSSIRSAQAVNTERLLNLRLVTLVLLLSCLRISAPFAKYMNNENNETKDNQKMILRQLTQSLLSHGPGLFKLLGDNIKNSNSSTLESILSPPPGLRYHKPNLPYLEDLQDILISYDILTPLISVEIIKIFDQKVPNSLKVVYNFVSDYNEIEIPNTMTISPLVSNYSSKLDYFSQPTFIKEDDDEF